MSCAAPMNIVLSRVSPYLLKVTWEQYPEEALVFDVRLVGYAYGPLGDVIERDIVTGNKFQTYFHINNPEGLKGTACQVLMFAVCFNCEKSEEHESNEITL